jgi:ABC-2 type transport system permease protein
MPTFLHLIRLSIQQQLTYRAALISGLATNFVFGLFRVALIVALYQGQTVVNGMSVQDALTYTAVAQALIAYLFIFGTYDLMNTVISGAIASDLVRPVPLFILWLGRDFGRALVNLLIRGILLLAVFALFYPVSLPSTVLGWLSTLLTLLLGWLVCYTWRFLVNLTAFWTPDARGIARGAYTFSQLMCGFILPLRLFPDWFARLCDATPFPAMFSTTVEIYLGLLRGPQLIQALLTQAAWFVALALVCHLVLRAGLRRLVVQGG